MFEIVKYQGPVALDRVRVNYPRWKCGMAEIGRAHQSRLRQGQPQSLLITGDPGAGKTTLMKTYAAHYPPIEEAERLRTRILFAWMPARPTEKTLSQALLSAIGDPFPPRSTGTEKTERLLYMIKACGVELIMLDEFQHILNCGSAHEAEVVDWLKTLVNRAGVSFVAAGLPSCLQLLQRHPQLRKRLSGSLSLNPFEISTKAGAGTFASILKSIGGSLPFLGKVNLAAQHMLIRQHFATAGLFGYVTKLWTRAGEIGEETKTDVLTLEHFESAFEREIWRDCPISRNPFSPAFNFEPLNRGGEPFEGIWTHSAVRMKTTA